MLDAETLAYAASPALLGPVRVHLTDACIERARSRDRHPPRPEFMRLRLRQRIECGRSGDAPPAPLPADLAGLWDAFVDCGDLLFCLVARPDEPSSFDAVTCFDPAFAWWSVRCADHPGGPADDDVVVEVTHHAVERYVERVRCAADERQAGSELRRLLTTEATLLPELPWWFAGQAQSDAPWFLVFDGWLVLPLVHRDRSRIRRYVAVTCLVRGLAPRCSRPRAARGGDGARRRSGPRRPSSARLRTARSGGSDGTGRSTGRCPGSGSPTTTDGPRARR